MPNDELKSWKEQPPASPAEAHTSELLQSLRSTPTLSPQALARVERRLRAEGTDRVRESAAWFAGVPGLRPVALAGGFGALLLVGGLTFFALNPHLGPGATEGAALRQPSAQRGAKHGNASDGWAKGGLAVRHRSPLDDDRSAASLAAKADSPPPPAAGFGEEAAPKAPSALRSSPSGAQLGQGSDKQPSMAPATKALGHGGVGGGRSAGAVSGQLGSLGGLRDDQSPASPSSPAAAAAAAPQEKPARRYAQPPPDDRAAFAEPEGDLGNAQRPALAEADAAPAKPAMDKKRAASPARDADDLAAPGFGSARAPPAPASAANGPATPAPVAAEARARSAEAPAGNPTLTRAEGLRRSGRCAEALPLFSAVLAGDDPQAFEQALFDRARCQAALDRPDDAQADLRSYLDRYPRGRFAAQARALLDGP